MSSVTELIGRIEFYIINPSETIELSIKTLPNSNIEGGFGLFSSTYASYFLVYLKPGKI